nr:Crp/Fnr family transcriptional regulator [Rhizobium sp. Q54]
MPSNVAEFKPDEDLVREHDRPAFSSLLLDGWAYRYQILANGRRQITAVHIPGDFVDLHSFLLKTMDHGVAALTACKVALVPHETLRKVSIEHPHLSRLLWLTTIIDAAILRKWLVGAGKRSVLEQIAHLICEMFTRLRIIEGTVGDKFTLPMTQAEISDALGISIVHCNRMIKELRARGLVEWKGNDVNVLDWGRLCELAEFDATYLNLQSEPR